jgi:hypothetical protein
MRGLVIMVSGLRLRRARIGYVNKNQQVNRVSEFGCYYLS